MHDLSGFALPLLAAVLAGGLIGFEREWRGRAAGFRTHMLVCLASALLMAAATTQEAWRYAPMPGTQIVSDPTRMAHGILTGVGFLCAGVIFRSGFSIHGLTTAASLWITAAIGLLFGAGLYGLGVMGTVLTATILVALRLVDLRLPQRTVTDVSVTWRREAAGAEDQVEALLDGAGRDRRADRFELAEGGEAVRRTFRVTPRDDAALKALAAGLRAVPGVVAYDVDPRDD